MQTNAAPVIIKRRRKKTIGESHHGGAWKVAYADFVTAMMAFFMLMWLLNATTEKQRKGLADYFNPTVAVVQLSGGGDGMFSGDSLMAERILAKNGTGATAEHATAEHQAAGSATGESQGDLAEEAQLAEVQTTLLARSGESMTMERLMRHVVTRITDEGLVLELFDLPDSSLFEKESAAPTTSLRELTIVLGDVLRTAPNTLAIAGHTRSYPLVLKDIPTWRLSSERAQAMRVLLQKTDLPESRFARVTGYADRKPLTGDQSLVRNNRLEVILLRRNR